MATAKSLDKIDIKSIPDGKICDFIDGTIRKDTPEEYVRQNIERRLVKELGYDPSRIAVEFSIKMASTKKRVDLAIFAEGVAHLQENIEIIIECKKDSIKPSNQKEGEGQLKSYLAACPNAEWGIWTNGRYKSVWRKVQADGRIEWEEPNDIPAHDGNTEEIDRPTRDALKRANDDNLLFSFQICHDHIYVTDGLQKQPAFFELLKIIFCKIYDERNFPKPLEFYATAKEKQSNDGRLTVKRRIGKIFDEVKKRYKTIFDQNDIIKLEPRSLAYIVGELQRYSFLDTNIDVKGKAYEELVGSNLRGDRGEFFTPRNIQRMVVRMLDTKLEEKILDPACGTGGFLVIAMNEVIRQVKEQTEHLGASNASDQYRQAIHDQIKRFASECFFGFDINPDLVKATKMNMVMNNDGSGNILRTDSLLHPHQWDSSFKNHLTKTLGIPAEDLRSPKDLSLFDVIMTNPPFGGRLPISDKETLQQYELGHFWTPSENGRWEKTEEIQTSQPPEILFIERCWQFLKPSGRMGIVLPDGILGNPKLEYVRYWIVTHCWVVASIDLHPDTFQPNNGTQTSVLILQRKTDEDMLREIKQNQLSDYEMFMAQIQAMGHDKRGNIIYRRDESGQELLFPQEGDPTQLFEIDSKEQVTARNLSKVKQIDDDTPEVADEFLRWKEGVVWGW